jgi:hypothetical protein
MVRAKNKLETTKTVKRASLRPSKVNLFLGDESISRIVHAAFPGFELSREKAAIANGGIKRAITLLHAPVDDARKQLLPSMKSVERKLLRLKTELDNRLTRLMLTAAGRKFASLYRRDNPSEMTFLVMKSGFQDYADYVQNLVDQLHLFSTDALRWLEYKDVTTGVVEDYSPVIKKYKDLIDSLAQVYEEIFEKPAGISRNGPATNFILAVFHEADLHEGRDSAIRELIVKSLSRRKQDSSSR